MALILIQVHLCALIVHLDEVKSITLITSKDSWRACIIGPNLSVAHSACSLKIFRFCSYYFCAWEFFVRLQRVHTMDLQYCFSLAPTGLLLDLFLHNILIMYEVLCKQFPVFNLGVWVILGNKICFCWINIDFCHRKKERKWSMRPILGCPHML